MCENKLQEKVSLSLPSESSKYGVPVSSTQKEKIKKVPAPSVTLGAAYEAPTKFRHAKGTGREKWGQA